MQSVSYLDDPRYQYYRATRNQPKTRDLGIAPDPAVEELFKQNISHSVRCFKNGFISAGRQRGNLSAGLVGKGEPALILESKFITEAFDQTRAQRARGLGYGAKHSEHYEYRSQEMHPRFVPDDTPPPIEREIDGHKNYKTAIAHARGYGDRHPHYSHFVNEIPNH